MGRAIDTVLGQVTNQVALTAITVAPGDTLQVKQFNDGSKTKLENVIVKGTAARTARILSPLLHDPVRGLTFVTAQAPSVFSMPAPIGQPLTKGDLLTVQLTSGAADSSAVAIQNYYEDMQGADASLYSWEDIAAYIDNIKPLEVDVTASATIGQWNDLALTTTENLLHANEYYAVLGYAVDVACLCVAVRGPDTGNLRVGGPGSVLSFETSSYWVDLSTKTGRPHIPVFNSNNAGSMTVSVADNAASTAVKVQLILAELSGFTPR